MKIVDLNAWIAKGGLVGDAKLEMILVHCAVAVRMIMKYGAILLMKGGSVGLVLIESHTFVDAENFVMTQTHHQRALHIVIVKMRVGDVYRVCRLKVK